MLNLEGDRPQQRFEGNVKLGASLDEATIQLINYVAPIVRLYSTAFRHIRTEVMFNEPLINAAINRGDYEKWRTNKFDYKIVRRRKEAIPYASKWYAFDTVLTRLKGGVVWYNGDETMDSLVESLKPRSRSIENDLSSSIVVSSDQP